MKKTRKLLALSLLFLFSFGFVTLMLPAASGFVLYLTPQQSVSVCDVTHCFYVSTTGSDATGNGSSSNPFLTITHAISVGDSNDPNNSTVVVGPGTYDEMVVIINYKITLMSLSGQPSNTIINATGQPVGIIIAGPATAGSIVEGFTVEYANNHGIYVQDSSKVIIENNVANGNGVDVIAGLGEDKAIQLAGTSGSTVAGNTVVGNEYGGIGITDDGPYPPSWNYTQVPISGVPAPTLNPGDGNVISGNYIAENKPNHCAIVLSAYNPGGGVSNNLVSDNVVVDNENGVIVAADTGNTVVKNNTVIGNQILNNGEGGIILHSNAPGDAVVGNVFMDNVISGNGPYEASPTTMWGIILGGFGPVAVVNTTIVGNTFANENIGIVVVNGNNTMLSGNIMTPTVLKATNGTVTSMTTTTAMTSSSSTSTTSGVSTTTFDVIVGVLILIDVIIVGIFFVFRRKPASPAAAPKTS